MTVSTENKTITFDQAIKLFKKYVTTSNTRPVLKLVYLHQDGYFYGTNSQVLLRLHKDNIVDIPENIESGALFDPKLMALSDNKSIYPDCSRLIPQYPNSTVLINQNLKDFIEQAKASKKMLTKKDGHISLDFTRKELTFRTIEQVIENKKFDYINEVALNNIYVEGQEVEIKLSQKYLLDALETVKKLSKISSKNIEMRMTGNFRPIHFTQDGVFDIIVMPLRITQ